MMPTAKRHDASSASAIGWRLKRPAHHLPSTFYFNSYQRFIGRRFNNRDARHFAAIIEVISPRMSATPLARAGASDYFTRSVAWPECRELSRFISCRLPRNALFLP